MKATLTAAQPHWNKYLIAAIILIILILTGVYAVNSILAHPSVSTLPDTTQITTGTLEEKYGLGVNLIAVTAAGGMVDLRLRIIDGEKAKTLLGDQANFPALLVGDGLVLRADEDIASQTLKFDNGSSVFLLYPNAQSVVKPGDPVTIVFGDLQLEAIQAK